jgi:hypothetical protein
VHLEIVAGPGELPTGRAIDFAPDSDIVIRDGEAAIAMRSWQSGTTRLRATSPGLAAGEAEVRTLSGPPFVPGKTPLAPERHYVPFTADVAPASADGTFGLNNPTSASSSAAGHSSRLANDGDPTSYWAAGAGDAAVALTVDLERVIEIHRLTLTFPQAAAYGFIAEVQDPGGNWQILADQAERQEDGRTRSVETRKAAGRKVRITLRVPAGAIPGLAELKVNGALRTE